MKRFVKKLPPLPAEQPMGPFLVEWLSGSLSERVSMSTLRKVVLAGGVMINRRRVREIKHTLCAGDVVEVYWDERRWSQPDSVIHSDQGFDRSSILYQDDAIIVVNKSPGISTQPTLDPGRANVFDHLKAFFKDDPNPYVGLHHRLDRDTSGCILFTRQERANKAIADQFKNHEIKKTYFALGFRSPRAQNLEKNETITVDDFLAKSPLHKLTTMIPVTSGGDRAITHVTALEHYRLGTWFKALPQTGRTHQIRVHCAGLGYPLFGDDRYFPPELKPFLWPKRLMLHASRLEWVHPVSGQVHVTEAPLPADFSQFVRDLQAQGLR